MPDYFLNLATKVFPENRDGGLMICGINWGGEADTDYKWTQDVTGDSFFSDRRFNNFKYRDRIAKWFELLGHPLASSEEQAGPFEHSLFQTNWLRNQSPNMDGKDIQAECIREWGNFEFHVARLKPKLIIFLSVKLLDVLNSADCAIRVRELLGEAQPPTILQREVVVGTERLKSFRVGMQRFREADVIALPHPTGSQGLSDDYVAAFKDVLSPIIATYKATRGFVASVPRA